MKRHTLATAVACALACAGTSEARITKITVTSTSPAYGGASIGAVGPYERVVGTAFGEIDPASRLNNVIVDVGLAPKNARGNVEYSFDFLNGNISQVWEYIDPAWSPSLYDYGGGDIDYLANGNYLISNNGLGEPPIPFGLNWSEYAEVRRSDSTKVWEIIIRDPAETKNYTGFEAKRVGSLYP